MEISRSALRCFDLLKSYASYSGRAFLFQKTIADKLGTTERNVQRFYHTLRAAGLIEVQGRGRSSAVVRIVGSVGSNVGSNVENVGSVGSTPITELKALVKRSNATPPKKPPESEIERRGARIQELLQEHGSDLRTVERIMNSEGWYDRPKAC